MKIKTLKSLAALSLTFYSLPAFSQMTLPPASSLTTEAKSAARRRVQELKVSSKMLGREVSFNLLLPRGYAGGTQHYPVLYLLHGSYDDHKSWNEKSGAAAYLGELPLIVVMPDAGMTRYINSPGLGRYEDFFLQELVPHIDQAYRTIARREGRALCGLSMGGYGAWRLGLDAPQSFVATAALSGSFAWGEVSFDDPGYHERAKQVYGGEGPEQRRQFRADAIWPYIEKNFTDDKWSGPALYFTVGTSDFLLPANRILRGRLEEKKIPFVYAENPGKHEWVYWDTHLRDALSFLMLYLATPENE